MFDEHHEDIKAGMLFGCQTNAILANITKIGEFFKYNDVGSSDYDLYLKLLFQNKENAIIFANV